MSRFFLIGFALLLIFDTAGQVGFKLAADSTAPALFNIEWAVRVFKEPWIYFAVGGYIGAFFTWMSLLKKAPIGPAFAASHLEIVTVLIISVAFLGERLSWLQILGCLSIVVGVIILAATETEE